VIIYIITRPRRSPTRTTTGTPIPKRIVRKTLAGAERAARRMASDVIGDQVTADPLWFALHEAELSSGGWTVWIERKIV